MNRYSVDGINERKILIIWPVLRKEEEDGERQGEGSVCTKESNAAREQAAEEEEMSLYTTET